jgi:hypothetical protein
MVGEALLEQGDSTAPFACVEIGASKIVAVAQSVRVVGTQNPLIVGQALLEQGNSPLRVSRGQVGAGEVAAEG